ncbi:hypothetical protein KR222_000831 [Zaprionus bogoriensis]|nr:hypothetical protein KR222_000831 [Zaprionus bogoriensis]
MLAVYASIFICLLASIVWAQETEHDCTQRVDYNLVSSCCSKPRLDFDAFRASCGRYMQEGSPKMSPCLYDCIFNASSALSGMQVNVENAQRMMQQLLGNNRSFLDVYVKSLQNCTENASKMLKNVRRRTFGSQQCSQLPLFLGMCTVENVFVHCPPSSWTRSSACETARDFMLSCKCDASGKVCIQMLRS